MKHGIDNFTNFIHTQYFSDGVKITLGVLLPSLIFFQFNQLEVGITLSLGALCVSISDSPGPWLHRKYGMLTTLLLIFITSFLTALINTNIYLLAVEILGLCFLFGMFNVYGERAASVGTAALLIMVLNANPSRTSLNLIHHTLLVVGGGAWYFLLSIIFSSLRPYRYAQQTLGECIGEIAEYLKLRARFYGNDISVENNFKDLVDQQIQVNNLLDNVREALFVTRKLMNESTNTGRLMVKVFVDMVDVFEQTMATNNDYESIREKYKDQNILSYFAEVIIKLSGEIEYVGLCLIHQQIPNKHHLTIADLDNLKTRIDALEKKGLNVFVLKKILINLRKIFNETQDIFNYFQQETQDLIEVSSANELSKFVNNQSFDWKLLVNNLNFKSSVFRFALRLAVACVIGFLIGKSFSIGSHSYWILLTILVIMKPGFSNTKQRNYERVIGTLIGGIIGGVILAFVHDEFAKTVILFVFMLITFSLIRIKYVISVIFMTPFILILFSFIYGDLSTSMLVSERIIDTLIGSTIAIIFSYFVLPGWESRQFKPYLVQMLSANLNYFEHIILRQSLMPATETEYKLARKDVYLYSANLAAAFQRMTKDPKNKQHDMQEIYKFVVLNHILSSFLANLSINFDENMTSINSNQLKLIRKTRFYLEEALVKVDGNDLMAPKNKLHIHLSETKADDHITEQLEQITKLSADLSKISEKL